MDLVQTFRQFISRQPVGLAADGQFSFSASEEELAGARLQLLVGNQVIHRASAMQDGEVFRFVNRGSSILVQVSLGTVGMRALDRAPVDAKVWVQSNKSAFPLALADVGSIAKQPKTYDLLAARVERSQWGVDAVFKVGEELHVIGWALRHSVGDVPMVFIDDRRALEVGPATSARAESLYWFLDEVDSLGFYARGPSNTLDGFARIDVRFASDPIDSAQRRRFPVYNYIGDIDRLPAIPPPENIHRVSGPTSNAVSYLNGGYSDFQRFKWMAETFGPRAEIRYAKMLDWGCGCGRIARHMLAAGVDITGIDIDQGNVEWCNSALKPGSFVAVDLMPPVPLASDSFDFIISSSVLSHLTEPVMHAWLEELARVLKPDGVALLSYNGDGTSFVHASRSQDAIDQLRNSGCFDRWKTPDLDSLPIDPEYYRLTLMTDQKASQIFSAHFVHVTTVKAAVSGHQNVAVLKKRRHGK